MGRQVAGVLCVVTMATVIVVVDVVFFRNRFWEQLAVNIGIVLVFVAFYFRFFTVADKKRLAARLRQTYSRMMSVDSRRITVTIREVGEGSVWRVTEPGGEPIPVSLMMLDIRKGRSPEVRMELAKALCADCIDVLGLRQDRLNVEFTQHSGDEMYHPSLGGYSPEWSSEEGHRGDGDQ